MGKYSLKYKNKLLTQFFPKPKKFQFNKFNMKYRSLYCKNRRGFSIYSLEFLLFRRKAWNSMHLVFKRFLRKPEKSLKKLWITPTYTFNLTKKSKGSRMGKGKGKKLLPSLVIQPGSPILEFTNVSGRQAQRLVNFLIRRWGVYLCLSSNAHFNSLTTNYYKNASVYFFIV